MATLTVGELISPSTESVNLATPPAGTLFGAMSVRTRARELVLSVVLFPLIAPALLSAVVGTRELLGGAPDADVLGWVRVLLAYDLVVLTLGCLLFEPLTSD